MPSSRSAVAALLLLPLPALAQSSDEGEVFFVDSTGSGYGTMPLEEGVAYTVTIHGTFSVWSPDQWNAESCGRHETGAIYPSAKNGRVSNDAEYHFAAVKGYCSGALPGPAPTRFNLDGEGFANWITVGAPRAGSRSHEYIYHLIGRGQPLGVLPADSYFGDNYGRLRVFVRPEEADLEITKSGSAGAQGIAYQVTVKNTGGTARDVEVVDEVTPAFNVQAPSAATPAPSAVSWDADDAGVTTWRWPSLRSGVERVAYTLVPEWAAVADGVLMTDLPRWLADTSSWLHRPDASGANDQVTIRPVEDSGVLVISNSPEPVTGLGEGPLYRQDGFTVSGKVRLVVYHILDGRSVLTTVGSALRSTVLYVAHNPGGAPVTLTRKVSGVSVSPDAIGCGHESVDLLMRGRDAPGSDALVIPPGGTVAVRVGDLVSERRARTNASGTHEFVTPSVVCAIYELDASGEVQLGTALVDTANAPDFIADPATYVLKGPTGRPTTSYAAAPLLPGTAQARGTFPHADREVDWHYDLDAAQRDSWRLGEVVARAPAGEYEEMMDQAGGGTRYNGGNYGVMYKIRLHVKTAYDATALQMLMSARGTEVTAVLRSGGTLVDVPHLGKEPPSAVGIGRLTGADAGAPYEIELMPAPAIGTPIALILSPAYVRNQAKVSWSMGPGPREAEAVIVPLAPATAATPKGTPTPPVPEGPPQPDRGGSDLQEVSSCAAARLDGAAPWVVGMVMMVLARRRRTPRG